MIVTNSVCQVKKLENSFTHDLVFALLHLHCKL